MKTATSSIAAQIKAKTAAETEAARASMSLPGMTAFAADLNKISDNDATRRGSIPALKRASDVAYLIMTGDWGWLSEMRRATESACDDGRAVAAAPIGRVLRAHAEAIPALIPILTRFEERRAGAAS